MTWFSANDMALAIASLADPCGEGCEQARTRLCDPGFEIRFDFHSNHGVETFDKRAGLDEREDARFDGGDGDAIGFAQVVAGHGHQTRNCSGGWHLLQILIRGLCRAPASRRSLADKARRTME